MAAEIHRLGRAIGAEIVGLDLRQPIDVELFARIHRAFLDHAVLVFRDQDLTPDAHIAFSRRFGELAAHVVDGFRLPGHPEVFVVSNVKEDGKLKGAIYAGQYWHTDLSYTKQPPLGSLLYGVEVPEAGGDTMFANMALAHEALSPVMQRILDGLEAVHDYAHAYETFFSKLPDRPPLTAEQRAKVPPVTHPAVRVHAETGKRVLYVNPGFTTQFVGMTEAESRPLLDFLFAHAIRPEFVYRHRWRKGDLVFWDNRCTMHYAVPDYDIKAERRHMHRTTVAGPVLD